MRRRLGALAAIFVVTRALLFFFAANPDLYGSAYAQVTTDIVLYEGWAYDMVFKNRAPYSSFPMEYPPGSVPFVAVPAADQAGAEEYDEGVYIPRFIGLMLLVDVAGLVGLTLLSRRWGSDFGLWVWIAGLFLLGPIVYARLDLVPAVATIWAVERASAGSWFGAGGCLGFGTLAKIYPAFLLPLAVAAAARRRQLAAGFALVGLLLLMPYAGTLGALFGSVMGFHSERGVHVESIWGTLLIFLSKLGIDANVGLSYGAFHVESDATGIVKALGTAAAVAVVVFSARRAMTSLPRGDAPRMTAMMFGMLALLLGVGTVFSPQFLIWVIALAAAGTCHPNDSLRSSAILLFPIAVATQVLYPFIYHHVVGANPFATLFVACRDLLVIVTGVGALAAARSSRELGSDSPGVTPADAGPSTVLS